MSPGSCWGGSMLPQVRAGLCGLSLHELWRGSMAWSPQGSLLGQCGRWYKSVSLPWDMLELYFHTSLQSPHLLCWQAAVAILTSWKKQRAGFQPGKRRQVLWVKDICSALKEMSAWCRFRNLELGVISRSCFQASLSPCHQCSAFCCVLQPPSSWCLRCCPCCAINVCHRHCCFPAGKLLLLWTAASASSSCKLFQ